MTDAKGSRDSSALVSGAHAWLTGTCPRKCWESRGRPQSFMLLQVFQHGHIVLTAASIMEKARAFQTKNAFEENGGGAVLEAQREEKREERWKSGHRL